MGVAAQLLTFCAQVAASQHLPVAAHGRSLDVAPTAGFNVNYGGCRNCVEGTWDCGHNADGPSLGLFITIGLSDFEPDAAPTSNADCGSLCAARKEHGSGPQPGWSTPHTGLEASRSKRSAHEHSDAAHV